MNRIVLILTIIFSVFSFSVFSIEKVSELVVINIDEDLSQLNVRDLKKLKTIEMERLLIDTATMGYYITGEKFEDIHYPTNPGEKGDYSTLINSNQYKGVYKISTSKICYLIEGTDDWECAVIYKKSKNVEEFY